METPRQNHDVMIVYVFWEERIITVLCNQDVADEISDQEYVASSGVDKDRYYSFFVEERYNFNECVEHIAHLCGDIPIPQISNDPKLQPEPQELQEQVGQFEIPSVVISHEINGFVSIFAIGSLITSAIMIILVALIA